MSRFTTTVFLFLVASCNGHITGERSDGDGDGDGPGGSEGDARPPVIEVTSPQRGTISQESPIVVRGRVTAGDSPLESLTVDGESVTVQPDGSFSTTVEVEEGITLIDTVATDTADNQANDVRAVLVGELVPQDTPVSEGVAARIDRQALLALGPIASMVASEIDFTPAAKALNPLADTGNGCNSAKIYVDSVDHGEVKVGTEPVSGGLDAAVVIRDPVVRGHVNFRALCIAGSAGWTITADAYDVDGLIEPKLLEGDIDVGLNSVSSGFRGFQLAVGNLPDFIVNLIEDRARARLADALRNRIRAMLPMLATTFLAEFLHDDRVVSMLGRTVRISVQPTAMKWTAEGASIALDTAARVDGAGGASYLSTPRPRPGDADMASDGIRVALADDLVNQLLGGVWAAGAFEDVMVPGNLDSLGAILGAEVAQATMSLALPPVADFDTGTGTARLTFGDMTITAHDESGGTVAAFVVSAEIDLAVETSPDGEVEIVTSTPRILAQVLEQSPDLLVPLDRSKVEALAEIAIKAVSLEADELLENLPVPGLTDITITAPTLQPVAGYLLTGGPTEVAAP